MRNPNGYGGVCKLPGKRRRPFMTRVTVGWAIVDGDTGKVISSVNNIDELPEELPENAKLRQLYKPIGYYKTRPEAMIALAEYNKNPYSLDAAEVTFAEIFEKWSSWKYEKAGTKSTELSYNAAYNYCTSLYNMKFVEIKADHLQAVVDNCPRGYSTKKNIRVLFKQLYEYAIKNDITTKDYSEFVDIGKTEVSTKRKPFTAEEIQKLWDNVDRLEYIDTILILIYSGMRISELLDLKNKDVDLDKEIMVGGKKTEAGKNRIIPINKKILPFIAKWKEVGHEYLLVNPQRRKLNYYTYRDTYWKRIMDQLELGDHLPHDTRHTFATLMDNAGANKLSIKRIMGHASKDITDKVYTHKDIEELKKAIDLI